MTNDTYKAEKVTIHCNVYDSSTLQNPYNIQVINWFRKSVLIYAYTIR